MFSKACTTDDESTGTTRMHDAIDRRAIRLLGRRAHASVDRPLDVATMHKDLLRVLLIGKSDLRYRTTYD
jgi:hypothetical protein